MPAPLRPTPPAAEPIVPDQPDPEPGAERDDPDWQRRGFDGEQRGAWIAAGLKPSEPVLAEQCRSAGIEPEQLARRVSGQTALSRLRGGEAATSVWARLKEGEDVGRGPGRLQGRFA